jgi:predicted transcriptional regulator
MSTTIRRGLSARIWVATHKSAGLTMVELASSLRLPRKTVNNAVCQMLSVNTLAKEELNGVTYYHVADSCKIASGVLLSDITGGSDDRD